MSHTHQRCSRVEATAGQPASDSNPTSHPAQQRFKQTFKFGSMGMFVQDGDADTLQMHNACLLKEFPGSFGMFDNEAIKLR